MVGSEVRDGEWPLVFLFFVNLFLLLTLSQTGKLERRLPILLYGAEYWREVVDFDAMVRRGTIAQRDLDLLTWVDGPEAALAALQRGLGTDVGGETPDFARSRTARATTAGG